MWCGMGCCPLFQALIIYSREGFTFSGSLVSGWAKKAVLLVGKSCICVWLPYCVNVYTQYATHC